MESSSIFGLFSIVLTIGVSVLRTIDAQECMYHFNTLNYPLNTERNGKFAEQQLACEFPTFDWIDTKYELYTDLTWAEPNRDFKLCFVQASHDKLIVRYTDSQRVSQPGYLIPTSLTAEGSQYCMTSVNHRLQIAFRQASEAPMNSVWISMRVQPLDQVVIPETEREDNTGTNSQCVSRERTLTGGEYFDITFGCSGENVLTWYDTSSAATTGYLRYGQAEQDFTACFYDALRRISVTQTTTGIGEIIDNTANRNCFSSSNGALELILRTLDPGTFNGIYLSVDITPSTPHVPGGNTGETDVGLVGDKCRLALKVTDRLNTILTCRDTTIHWADPSIPINPAIFTWYKRNEDFSLCFIRASHAIDVQSQQTGQSFRISTTDKYMSEHCVKASSFLVSASLTISSFTYDAVDFVVRVIPSAEVVSQPSSCSLVFLGVESFSAVLHCPETTINWYDTEGVLAGVVEWYQGVDFITCIKDSAKPLSLTYIKGGSPAGVSFSYQKYPKGYCMLSQAGKLAFTFKVDGTYETMPVEMEIQPCQSLATCVLPNNDQNEVDPQSGSDDNTGKDTNGDGLDDLMNYSDSESSGLTATAIILIVLAVVLVLLIVVIFVIAYCHKKNKMENSDTDSDTAVQAKITP